MEQGDRIEMEQAVPVFGGLMRRRKIVEVKVTKIGKNRARLSTRHGTTWVPLTAKGELDLSGGGFAFFWKVFARNIAIIVGIIAIAGAIGAVL